MSSRSAADKSAMQLRWDDFSRIQDRGGRNDHGAIARFLGEPVNEAWPLLPLDSLRVAYRLLGLQPPAPQGRVGYVTAIRTRMTALREEGDGAGGANVPRDAGRAAGGAARRGGRRAQAADDVRPVAQAAEDGRQINNNAQSATSNGEMKAMFESFAASFDTKLAHFDTKLADGLRVSRQPPSSSPPPTRASNETSQPEESTSTSSGSVAKETANPLKRDTITIDDADSDSDSLSKKYVDSGVESLRARNVSLSEHIKEYDSNVGWKNKRNRHEAVEVARLYDAAVTETMLQIRRRLMARYLALEAFDETGAVEVFEHIQTSGNYLMPNSIRQTLHRNLKRSAISTAAVVSPVTKKHKSHHNSNHNNHSSGGRYGRESSGRPPSGTAHKSKSSSNGQGAGKNDSAGNQ
jgi:hypothetical protein